MLKLLLININIVIEEYIFSGTCQFKKKFLLKIFFAVIVG